MSRSPITSIDNRLTRISRFLSLVLRHKPESIGLSLDSQGWAEVDELLEKAQQAGRFITLSVLETVVRLNDKQRFRLNEDGARIRASQGHSVPVDLGLEPTLPPHFLYHGTAERFIKSIQREGLVPRGRNHVHLWIDERSALNVGKRHGKPVVLTIQSEQMNRANVGSRLCRPGTSGADWISRSKQRESPVLAGGPGT